MTAATLATAELWPDPGDRVRRVTCGACWTRPGTPCTPAGMCLGRWTRAFRHGYVTSWEIAMARAIAWELHGSENPRGLIPGTTAREALT